MKPKRIFELQLEKGKVVVDYGNRTSGINRAG